MNKDTIFILDPNDEHDIVNVATIRKQQEKIKELKEEIKYLKELIGRKVTNIDIINNRIRHYEE